MEIYPVLVGLVDAPVTLKSATSIMEMVRRMGGRRGGGRWPYGTRMIKNLDIALTHACPHAHLQFDSDGDGTIDEQEFSEFITVQILLTIKIYTKGAHSPQARITYSVFEPNWYQRWYQRWYGA